MKLRRADLSDPRDCGAIDAFVASSDEARLFHRPQWSRAVEAGCGATSHYLVCENGTGLRGLLPLNEIRSPLFGNSMVSTGFGVAGGILAEDDEVASALAEAGWALARERGCSGLELRGGRVPQGGWTLTEGVYANFSGDLPQGDEAILLSIKKRQRAEVRRAKNFGLSYTEGSSAADLDTHFRIYGASVRNLGSPVFPRRLFQAMAHEFGEDAIILTAFKDGVPLSSVFSFVFKGTIHPYWGGGTEDARTWRANEAVYYELMCRASRRGCTRSDFGRSKLGTGAYAFKKNWGYEPEPLTYAVRTADGSAKREINPLNPKYRLPVAAWKKLPLPIANRLGPFIARGLAEMADILFVAHRIPYPPDRGDKIRSWHMLKHLAGQGRVHLACFADDESDSTHLPALREALGGRLGEAHVEIRRQGKAAAGLKALLRGLPVSLTLFDSPSLRRFVERMLERPEVDTIFVYSGQMAQFVPQDLRQNFVMDFGDVDSAKFADYAARGGPLAWVHRREAARLGAFEGATSARANTNLFVSEAEADLFRRTVAAPGADVRAIQNGVDLVYYDPASPVPPAEAPHPLIVFTGQMDYAPNIDAVGWFAREVLPLIPGARFAIVGRKPSEAVTRLAGPRVIVTGAVDDVRGWLAAADVVVAPLRIARGIQNKVLEAMAMRRPVVASPAAFEGIDAVPGRDLLVAQTAEAQAAAVASLLADPAFARALGTAARRRMENAYRWDAKLAPLTGLVSPARFGEAA